MDLFIFLSFMLGYGILYVLIAIGAKRVVQVTARFFLDSLPGRIIAIDKELESGFIDSIQANLKKEKLNNLIEKVSYFDNFFKILKLIVILQIIIFSSLFIYGLTDTYIVSACLILWIGTLLSLLIGVKKILDFQKGENE